MKHSFSKCLSNKAGGCDSGTMVWGKVGAQSHLCAIQIPTSWCSGTLMPQSLEDRLVDLLSMASDRTEELAQSRA